MSGTHIDDLPEGVFLYEESSVRRVSQAIRVITGTTQKFSHVTQPEAIRNLRNNFFPTFSLGKAAGGIGFWNTDQSIHYNLQSGDGSNGPIFTNFLYSLRENEKNANIIFSFKRLPDTTSLAFVIKIGDVTIKCGNAPTDAISINDGQYYGSYADGDECRIIIDSYHKTLSVTINDVVIAENLSIGDTYFNHTTSIDYSRNIGLQFPTFANGYGTQQKRCDLYYLRITTEDWE